MKILDTHSSIKLGNFELTPTERLALKVQDLEAQLRLADEQIFYLVAKVRALESEHLKGAEST